jgi:FeS assembly SUF system regulator
MLRVSRLADYATVVMAFLAQSPGGSRTAPDIAAATGLENPTVSKILKRLVRTGLLQSQRGPKGGYQLAQQPVAISLADIIEAMDDHPMGLTRCSQFLGLCANESSCSVRTNWQRISREIYRQLSAVTLADLVDDRSSPRADSVVTFAASPSRREGESLGR